MNDLDHCLQEIGRDAGFGEDAASRLDRRLSGEVAPRVLARRRDLVTAAAFAIVAGLSGAGTGAMLEAQATQAASPMLPASLQGTAADLLFGEG